MLIVCGKVGRMLAYTTRGEGDRAVIMLHGFLGSGRNLGLIARRWSARDPKIRLVLPDLTGHGASPPLPPNADLEVLARDVLELATALALPEPFMVVGHSLGGRVAVKMAMLANERIGFTVLLDSTPAMLLPRPTDLHEVIDAVLAAPDRAAGREEMAEHLLGRGLSRGLTDWLLMNLHPEEGGQYVWRIDRKALAEMLRRSRGEDVWDGVGRKTRVVWAARSPFVTAEDREELERRGAELIAIEGAGHFLHVEKPEAVLDAIMRPPRD